MGITTENQTFEHPLDSSRDCYFFNDFEHEFRLLRNHSLDKPVVLPCGLIFSVKDFRQLQAKCESEISCGFHLEDILLEVCSSDRQNTKYALRLFSELTAANFHRFFPEDRVKCALAKLIGLLAKAFKIMSSRVIFNQENDKWQDALRVHLQEQTAVLMELVFYLENMKFGKNRFKKA